MQRKSSIPAATRVWARKSCDASCASQCGGYRYSWGRRHDWTKPAPVTVDWTPADFDTYQRRTRYTLLPD